QQEADDSKHERTRTMPAETSVAGETDPTHVVLPTASCLLPTALTPLDDWLWQTEECAALLLKQFGARSLDGYGLTRKSEAIRAAGACLRYAQETQRAAAAHI